MQGVTPAMGMVPRPHMTLQQQQGQGQPPPEDTVAEDLDVHEEPSPEPPALRQSTRTRHPPVWYGNRIVSA